MSLNLADVFFWVGVASCAVAQAAIVRSTIRARTVAPARRGTEIAWAVVPAFALAALLFFTWRTMHPIAHASTSSIAQVQT